MTHRQLDRAAGAALVAVIGLSALLAVRQISAHDLGFHLEAGNWILDGHGWPGKDPFTYTLGHRDYVDTSWGYQVLVALLERAGGTKGVVLFHALLVSLVFALVARTASRLAPGSMWLAPLLLLGGIVAEPRFETRPELWSWLMLALLLDRLHRHATRRVALWPLVVLFLVWANSHSLFILGWGALACFLVGLALRDRRWDLRLAGWSAAAVGVTLLNPYGWRAPLFAFGLGTRLERSNPFAQSIGEFQSPIGALFSDGLQFYLPAMTAWLLLTASIVVALFGLRSLRRADCLALLCVFFPLSLLMVRNVPLLAIAGVPGAVVGLEALRPWGGTLRAQRVRWLLPIGVLGVVVLLAPRVVTDAFYVDARRQQRFGWDWNHLVLPVHVAAWAERVRPPEPVLNDLAFGGYLLWARDEPVYIDSRLEVVGEEFFRTYKAAFGTPAGLEAVVDRYGVGWIVFPYRLRPDSNLGLSRHPHWRLAYVDALAVAFVRADAWREGLSDASARGAMLPVDDEIDVRSLPGLGGGPRRTGLAAWLAGSFARRAYPDEEFNRGVFHYTRNEPQQAAWHFARAIERSQGSFYEIYGNLGASLTAMGRLEEARACLSVMLEELPWYRVERRRLTLGQLAEVERALE